MFQILENLSSMEHDLDIMERTERLVSEMLKSVMGINTSYKLPYGISVDDGVECLYIDENGEKFKENHERSFHDTNGVLISEETVEVSEKLPFNETDNINLNELDAFIVDGLYKIRMEYPMYSDCHESYAFGSQYDNGPTPIMAACPNANMNSPYRIWYAKPTIHGDSWPIFQNNSNSNLSGNLWNDGTYSPSESNISLKWSYSNQSVSATNTSGEENCVESSNDDVEAEISCNQENDAIIDSNALPEESHIVVNRNQGNSDPPIDTNEDPDCSPSGDSPLTAIHAEQTTTTTTTTSDGFGLLHQQMSSCTTTNFIPNSLANAVLANSTAALYAQSILTSTAHQYLSVFRKEVQQYLSKINYSAMSIPNLNLGFYERLFLAQLLQQQIAYQQQQQIALVAFIQQQKLAAQISTNIAASTTTFLPSSSNSISNANFFGASVSPSRSGLNNNNNNINNNINNSNSSNNAWNGYSQSKVNTNDFQAIITEEYLGTNHKSNSE